MFWKWGGPLPGSYPSVTFQSQSTTSGLPVHSGIQSLPMRALGDQLVCLNTLALFKLLAPGCPSSPSHDGPQPEWCCFSQNSEFLRLGCSRDLPSGTDLGGSLTQQRASKPWTGWPPTEPLGIKQPTEVCKDTCL